MRDTLVPSHVWHPLGRVGSGRVHDHASMGHSSVTVSQKYVHPTPETMERAFERLDAMNQKAIRSLPEGWKRKPPATVSATVGLSTPELTEQTL